MEALLRRRPDLADLHRLAEQLRQDAEQPLAVLQTRDRQLAGQLPAGDAASQGRLAMLLGWLDRVAPPPGGESHLRGDMAAQVAGLLALLLGFAGMAGLLLGSDRALVNVLLFLALFVVLQWVSACASAVVLWRLWRGQVPQVLPLHPGRWVVDRRWPDLRDLREARPLLRLLLLRHGQALGALFTLGAVLAFLIMPLLADYSFVWGSTYALGDATMQSLVDGLAAPWQALLPAANVPPEVLAGSRYHAAMSGLDADRLAGMRGWWPFLMLCLLCYALLPRLLLWGLSRHWYRRQLDRAFLGHPGVARLLGRLTAPLVTTAAEAQDRTPAPAGPVPGEAGSTRLPATEPGSLLLEVAGALGVAGAGGFEELSEWRPAHSAQLWAGDLQADRRLLESLPEGDVRHLYLVVKGWEPPVAELADLLEPLAGAAHCSVLLAPLPGRPIPHRKVEDWRQFSRTLPFHAVDLQLLSPVVAP